MRRLLGLTYQSTDKDPGDADVGGGGVGQNAYYNLVKFVGVQITTLDKSTDAYMEPAAVHGTQRAVRSSTVVPAGTTSS